MTLINTLIEGLLPIAKRFFPADPDKAQQLAQDMAMARLQADTDLSKGQMEINKQEAAHRSIFVAGWRPFLGWGLAFCFIWQGFGFQMAAFVATLIDPAYDVSRIPVIENTAAQTSILLGMLGLGGFRTIEKLKGVSK